MNIYKKFIDSYLIAKNGRNLTIYRNSLEFYQLRSYEILIRGTNLIGTFEQLIKIQIKNYNLIPEVSLG
jgi:hypothetical protein